MRRALGVLPALLLAWTLPAAAEETDASASEHAEPATADGAATSSDAGPGWSATRRPMPFDVLRSVQALQDQVARGNSAAIRVQALLLRRFTQSFASADPAVWLDARNRRAAILFTLSGGPPELLDALHRDNRLAGEDAALAEGALLYVRNDLEAARKRLATIDALRLEPVLGAQLSLVMGQILQADAPADALVHLDRARLLAPGTLIEEAALRLATLLADQVGRHAEADRWARRYFDRYADSTYVGNFEARFAAIVTTRAKDKPDEAFDAMSDVVSGLPDDRQARLFLAVARRSLVESDLGFSHRAAARALGASSLSPADRTRATLYETASLLTGPDVSATRARLDAIDRAQLHPEDVLLLDAAYRVLDAIAAPDVALATVAEPTDPSILTRAEQALAAADQLSQTQP